MYYLTANTPVNRNMLSLHSEVVSLFEDLPEVKITPTVLRTSVDINLCI